MKNLFEKRSLEAPLVIIYILIVFSLLFWRLWFPPEEYYDEVYHVKTAYQFIQLKEPAEWTHPPLGKLIISLGILMLGSHSFAWRAPSALFGVMLLGLLYLFARRLFGNRLIAFFSMILLSLDGVFFTMSRIGMVNIYSIFFIFLSYYIFTEFYQRQRTFDKILPWLGISIGLAISTKWTGLYAIGTIFILSLFTIISNEDRNNLLCGGKTSSCFLKIGIYLIILPLFIYLLSYFRFLQLTGPGHTLKNVIRSQIRMWNYHSGLEAPHPYICRWWSWLFILRPIWFYFHKNPNSTISGIVCIGNPAIFWLSIPALLVMAFDAIKRRSKACIFILAAFCFHYLSWAISPRRVTFFHHISDTVPLLCIAISYWLYKIWNKRFGKLLVISYLIIVLILFIYFYPLLSGYPISGKYYRHHIWFKKWI